MSVVIMGVLAPVEVVAGFLSPVNVMVNLGRWGWTTIVSSSSRYLLSLKSPNLETNNHARLIISSYSLEKSFIIIIMLVLASSVPIMVESRQKEVSKDLST